jgi:hypothetical protein
MWAATDDGLAKGTRPSASISAKAGEVCRSAARPTGAMVARPVVDGRGSPTTAWRESWERRVAPLWVFLDSIVSLIIRWCGLTNGGLEEEERISARDDRFVQGESGRLLQLAAQARDDSSPRTDYKIFFANPPLKYQPPH